MNKDPNFVNKRGETPLFKAKTAKEVELLVARGADVNAVCKGEHLVEMPPGIGTTPLFAAVNAEVQAALLAAGADPNAVDECGRTALFHLPPDPAFARNLIRAGANVRWADMSNDTPLHYAVVGDYPETVNLLLLAGADVNARNLRGGTPLFYTHVESVADLLLRSGADPNAQNEYGRTPLFCRDECFDPYPTEALARLFLAHGADVNARDHQGMRPLHLAPTDEMAVLLLDHGADPFATDNEDNLPSVPAAAEARAAHCRSQLLAVASPRPNRAIRRAM